MKTVEKAEQFLEKLINTDSSLFVGVPLFAKDAIIKAMSDFYTDQKAIDDEAHRKEMDAFTTQVISKRKEIGDLKSQLESRDKLLEEITIHFIELNQITSMTNYAYALMKVKELFQSYQSLKASK